MIDKERDKRWSAAVKKRDKHACRYCGATFALESCHVVPRANKYTRYLLSNGYTMCSSFGCRFHAMHHSLNEWEREQAEERLIQVIGETMYYALWDIANGSKHDFEEVE